MKTKNIKKLVIDIIIKRAYYRFLYALFTYMKYSVFISSEVEIICVGGTFILALYLE